MPDLRLIEDDVYRIGLASPLAFADWTDPTSAEFNANPTNSPSGLIWNLTCAINTDTSQFDLDDPDFDDSTTFCQKAGDQTRMTENATIIYNVALSKERWTNAASLVEVDTETQNLKFNTSTLAQSLLRWRGIEYFAWMSIGKGPDEPFAAGDVVYLVRVVTDHGTDEVDTGSMASMTNALGYRSDILWSHTLTS